MIIRVNNLEFNFKDVRKNNEIISFYHQEKSYICKKVDLTKSFSNEPFSVTSRVNIQIKNSFVIDMIKNSMKSYVSLTGSESSINDSLCELFTLFKISTNLLIKKNMSSKIGYIFINYSFNKIDNEFLNLIHSYQKKNDKFYSFILLMMRQKNEVILDFIDIEDDENFDFIDFLLDD